MQEFNDNYQRMLYGMRAGIGGAPVSHDVLTGEVIGAAGSGLQIFLPFKWTTRGTDVVKDALEDIEFDSTVVYKEMNQIKLTPEHRSRLQYLMSQTPLYEELKAWVTQPGFEQSRRDYRRNLETGATRLSKNQQLFYSEVTNIFRRNRDLAVETLKQEFPQLEEQIQQYQLEKYEAGTGIMLDQY